MSTQAQIFPGIYFETAKPAVKDVLPHMDIASFVGFSSSGPLHTPVMVESVQQFRQIFGADLALAWDAERNDTERSYLGLTVETFFRNGGRRCWVVRVADEDMAQTARYAIPGLIRTNGDTIETAYAEARSPGGWAEGITTSTVLQIEQLQPVPVDESPAAEPVFQVNAANWYIDVIANDSQVVAGDLICVNMLRDDSQLYLFVAEIETIEQGVRLSGTQGYFYTRNVAFSPEEFDSTLAIPGTGNTGDFLVFKLDQIAALGVPDEWSQSSPVDVIPSVKLMRFEMMTRDPGAQNQRLSNLGFIEAQKRFWGILPSDENLFRQQEGQIIKKYSDATRALLDEVTTPRFPLCAQPAEENWFYLPSDMDLQVKDAKQSKAEFLPAGANRLQREGLTNFGARVFVDERLQNIRGELLKQQASALAYMSESPVSGSQNPQKLKGIHSLMLLDEVTLIAVPDAVHRRWDAEPPPFNKPLQAPILQDISVTGVQDEYRIFWELASETVNDIASYTLEWSADPDFADVQRINISGNPLPGVGEAVNLMPAPATEYLLSIKQNCPLTYYFRVRAERSGELSSWSNNKARLIPESDFLDCQFADAGTSELTLAVADQIPQQAVVSPAAQGLLLSWQFMAGETATADYFQLQRASDRLFDQAELVFSNAPDTLTQFEDAEFYVEGSPESSYFLSVESKPDSSSYYRVRAIRRETVGPWSNTLLLWPSQLSQTTLQPVIDFSSADILAIHRALLRCCYARGDLFAVLSLPRHYQVQDTLDHYAKLKPSSTLDNLQSSGQNSSSDLFGAVVPALTVAEKSAATHAALYYPWVVTATESNGQGSVDIRILPPDGPIVGKIATRTLAQGAWIAPANSPLNDVLALSSQLSDAQWAQLTTSRINVVRQAANGFILLSANTLSTDSELGSINVRRLMSLLLRLALREGNRYVFEPNNALFQERVQQHFETVFTRLYERGAFAGSTASQGFRVVTDSSVNTLQSMDAGRFIVELRVAPSRALKFIRVRLLQSGSSQLQVQEV